MARRKKGYRVRGPYRHRRRYRIEMVGPEGQRIVESFETEALAKKAAARWRRQIPGTVRMEVALEKYRVYLRRKGNKVASVDETLRRLYTWHGEERQVSSFSPKLLEKAYRKRTEIMATDTHRNELGEVKTFWRWCVREGMIGKSPAEGIEPVGRRRKGKMQLRKGEAQAFYQKTVELCQGGDEGAVAVLAVLTLGLRSGEIRKRKVRDVDVAGDSVLLWIEDGKTHAATRHMEVPEPLASFLVRQAGGREPGEWLFPSYGAAYGHRTSTWLLRNVKSICRATGVPVVCAHGLRGTWATLTTDAGVSGHIIARELGHTSHTVTEQHYVAAGASDRARARKMLSVISGGKKESRG